MNIRDTDPMVNCVIVESNARAEESCRAQRYSPDWTDPASSYGWRSQAQFCWEETQNSPLNTLTSSGTLMPVIFAVADTIRLFVRTSAWLAKSMTGSASKRMIRGSQSLALVFAAKKIIPCGVNAGSVVGMEMLALPAPNSSTTRALSGVPVVIQISLPREFARK